MKRSAALAAVLLLGGCQTMPWGSSPSKDLLDVCATYAAALAALAVHRQLDNLSERQAHRVDVARDLLNPICQGPVPLGDEAELRALTIRAETALQSLIKTRSAADASR